MKILLILGHPNEKSFNHAIAEASKSTLIKLGHQVVFHDLYAEGFDPILPNEEIPSNGEVDPKIQTHCRELVSADGIIIVHPTWWGQPPAILKGWIDRVVRPGVAYRFYGTNEAGIPEGLLKARAAIIFNTSNTHEEREQTHFGDPLEDLWKICIWDFCGVKRFVRKTFSVMVLSTPKQREQWLKEVDETVAAVFPKDGQV